MWLLTSFKYNVTLSQQSWHPQTCFAWEKETVHVLYCVVVILAFFFWPSRHHFSKVSSMALCTRCSLIALMEWKGVLALIIDYLCESRESLLLHLFWGVIGTMCFTVIEDQTSDSFWNSFRRNLLNIERFGLLCWRNSSDNTLMLLCFYFCDFGGKPLSSLREKNFPKLYCSCSRWLPTNKSDPTRGFTFHCHQMLANYIITSGPWKCYCIIPIWFDLTLTKNIMIAWLKFVLTEEI